MKEKWQQPQLIVAVRGKPEETLETGCKNPDIIGPDLVASTTCNYTEGPGTTACSASNTS